MREFQLLQRRLVILGAIGFGFCVVAIVLAVQGQGYGTAGVGIALIYVGIRIGHTTREIAKLQDRLESADEADEQSR